jgi:serine/threonine-protein kinase
MRIGSYEVLLELARGGMGKVYLARSVGPGGVERLVAIKRAHEHLLVASKAVAERFLDEARTAALVHHSNVIGVHQAGSDEDGYYLVLDYVEGVSLDGLVEAAQERGGRVPPQIVLRVVCDALAGLHAAHEATDGLGRPLGILHRDVSAQNLLVGRDGVTRLSDFGIAKSALSLVVTDEVYVQGKLAYMAPEYLRRKPVDRTLDVYAMGITLYLALSGDLPWPGADEAQLVPAILLQGVPPLAARSARTGPIGEELCAVVDRACHRDAKQRFRTARAMLDALETAGKAIGGLARHVEVAEFVDGLVGDELLSRRELVKSARVELEASRPDATPAPPSAPAAKETTGRHERAEGWAPDEPRASGDVVRREDRRAWKAIGYVAVAAATFTIATAVLRRGGARNEQDVGSRSPDTISAAAPKATHVEPSASPEPLPSSAPGPAVTPKADDPAHEASTEATKPETHPPAESRPPTRSPRRKEKISGPVQMQPAPSSGVVPFSTANPYR